MNANPAPIRGSDMIRDDICNVSISMSPNFPALESRLIHSYKLQAPCVRAFIYAVVKNVNTALFPPVTKLELVLTNRCNLACAYCFERDMIGNTLMSPDVARASIDLLFEYSSAMPSLDITYFGGEPTLNFPVLRVATEYAEEKARQCGKSVDFGITSNGISLTEKMIEYLANHKIKVLLSIDGLAGSHNRYRVDRRGGGTFERVVKKARLLKKVQPWLGARLTVMPDNAKNLYYDVVGLYELGFNQFIISHATGAKWSEHDMNQYEEGLRRLLVWYKETARTDVRINEFEGKVATGPIFGCSAGRSGIAVSVNGEISPCSKMLAIDSKRVVAKLGDVDYGLTHIRNRYELVFCAALQDACDREELAAVYKGGCYACNHEENGNIFEPSIMEHKFSICRQRILEIGL
jgi:uncharacterized protein